MSDVMLLGVLRMPVNPMNPLQFVAFVQRARQAADRIEADADRIAALEQQNAAQRKALEEVRGCFEAAEIEGLSQALLETSDERLKDLIMRRLMYANVAAASALEHQLPAASQQAKANIHSRIMNLPCRVPPELMASKGDATAYKIGHRDARHAAAELVAAPLTDREEKMQSGAENNAELPCGKKDADLLQVLREVRNALQFANDTPNGGINGTIWMMHSPETLFDYIDAAIAAQSSGQNKDG